MSYTSRETSPDPLAGSSSPMALRLHQTDAEEAKKLQPRRSSRPLASRSHNIASPSKSFVMDTGPAGDASPWRIKVAVEAEPHDGSSPSKRMTRTTKVPLKGSSSPAKRSPKKKALLADESEVEIKRPQRKRKGTPIRRNVKRSSPPKGQDDADIFTDVQPSGQIEMSQRLQEELLSPTKAPITRSQQNRVPQPSAAERVRRLSKARAQVQAIEVSSESGDNLEDQDEEAEILQSDAALGDMTVANEDFTMISVTTLESMKQGNTSQLLDNSGYGDKSAASVSYMPSSPPQPRQERSDVEPPTSDAQSAEHLNISDQGDHIDDSNNDQQAKNIYDDMSWKPTGPLNTPSIIARLDKLQHHRQMAEPVEYRLQREAVSRRIESAKADEVVVIDSSHSSLSVGKSEDECDDQAVLGAEQQQEEDGGDGREDDIWAEEASRSLDGEQEPQPLQQQPSTTAAVLNELFSDQPSRPPRAKIPRTWRRTSGMDFSYVDSPAHEVLQRPKDELRKVSATSTGSSRDGDGVLTPPDSSFDEEEDDVVAEEADHDEQDIDLTHPDAAATQLQVEERELIPQRLPAPPARESTRSTRRNRESTLPSITISNSSNSLSSNSTSESNDQNEEEDTGMFWQTHLPSVYQQTRQRRWGSKLLAERRTRTQTRELSEILRSSSDVSLDQKVAHAAPAVKMAKADNLEERVTGQLHTELKHIEKVINSPLRKSLLRSSKVGTTFSPRLEEPSATGLTTKSRDASVSHQSSNTEISQSESRSVVGESFDSTASDQRQLLAEMQVDSARSAGQYQTVDGSDTDIWGPVSEDNAVQHTLSEASYQGSSPGSGPKYKDLEADDEVCDNEDMEQMEEEEKGYGSELVDDAVEGQQKEGHRLTRSYEEHLNLDSPLKIKVKFNDSEGNSSMLAPKKAYPPLLDKNVPPAERIMVQKQATSRPTTPSEQEPGLLSRLTTTIWSALIRPSGPTLIDPTPEPEFSLSLRLNIRSRYGVLSDQNPWTIAHMRTLHRLLNSCTSNKTDSLVPKSGPLPAALRCVIGKEVQCTTEFKWKFTEQHAHIVDCFMQTLVSAHYTDAIRTGEVEFIGDDFALLCRGFWGGRHGDDPVWDEETIAQYPLLRNAKGSIQRSFVVSALGNAVSANVETAEREAKEKLDIERIAAERKAWERKMGVVHEEEIEEGNTGELSTVGPSEIQHIVRRK